ncbi:MAG: M1 family metallopeptidase [Deltaproteobacteria bacterium]|nr:M1 family metallopeptidase [Deltaproteobacteria bacterium]
MTASITPMEYKLTIEPDLGRFSFAGRMTLSANADQPTDTLTLDCAELAIWQCRIQPNGSDDNLIDCPFTVNPANANLTIHLPEPLSGPFQLTIDYAGKINDRMAGFYRSRIKADKAPDYIAVTQFQESDARRAFPCLDHPAQKAVFSVEMIIDSNLTAISNTGIQTITDLENGRRRVAFHPTPKMSTYLLFFGVGPFEIHEDAVDRRVRAVCLPGMGDQTEFGREFGRKALAYGENYYDIDYPLTKMDLIAVPDFAFGAMENWGAITFRENLLLNVPGVTSREAEARICEVIAHEITHQWFGNLVTPEEWKYLWLNESFATYFGYGMVDHHYPAWEIWDQFVRSQTETALSRDALNETFAIEMPGGAPVAITTSTAPIIYSKGGSILRQLEAWIGPDPFKAGLRRYLTDFAYGNAASHHLWESLSTASGMPVAELMRNWVTQPGFPVITAERKDNTLSLRQRRFTFLPNDAAQTWLVPVTITAYSPDGAADTQTILLRKKQTDVALPANTAAYKINTGQTGFYHVCYNDAKNLTRLGVMVAGQQLPPLDRWGLQNDLFALVKSGLVPMAKLLDMAENFLSERAYLPLSSLDSHLFEAFLLLRGEIRTRTARLAMTLMNGALDALGHLPAPDETQTTAMLRDQLLVHGALIGNPQTLDFLTDQFNAFLGGSVIAPDIFRGVMTAGAVSGGGTALEAMIGRFEASSVEHERMTLAGALGSFNAWPLLEQALDYTLEKVPDRIRFMPLVAAAGNPAAMDRLWPWFVDNFPRIERMHPLLFERVVAAFVPGPGLQDPDRTSTFCNHLQRKQPRLRDVIALSLERLEINAGFRQREK